jgi:mRNA interferase MazF
METIQFVLGQNLLRAADRAARRLSYLSRITVAPVPSTIRGVPSEVALGLEDGLRRPCAVNLHHVATVSKESLGRRLCQLDPRRMREVCGALDFALGCGG